MRTTVTFLTLAVFLVSLDCFRLWLSRGSLDSPVPDRALFAASEFSAILFSNPVLLAFLHTLGTLSFFLSAVILNCSPFDAFLLIAGRVLVPVPVFDLTFVLVNLNFFIISLIVVLMRRPFPIVYLVAISGLLSAFSVILIIELYSVALLAFFSFLFFWLRHHQIGNDDTSADDAIATVVTFMISFTAGFYLFGYLLGFPRVSKEFWTLYGTIRVFPILRSKLAISSCIGFFFRRDSQKTLLCLTCLICSQFFRVLPIATEGAGFEVSALVAGHVWDVGAVVFVTGNSHRFAGVFTLVLFVSLSLIGSVVGF
jgi:hypothetical protein